MNINAMINEHRALNTPVFGTFPEKPNAAKSLNSWMKEGKIPVTLSSMKVYQMQKENTKGYGYFLPSDVRDMTPDEIRQFEEIMGKRMAEKAENKPAYVQRSFGTLNAISTKELSQNSSFAIAFDTETTGLSPDKGAELLQLSIVNESGACIFNSYLKPTHTKKWPEAEAVNHISPSDVEYAPLPVYVRAYVQDIFDHADVIIGHNVGFDVRFVTKCMDIKLDESKLYDTCTHYKEEFPDEKHKLINAVERYCPQYMDEFANNAHDSLADTKATMMVYKAQMERIQEKDQDREADLEIC